MNAILISLLSALLLLLGVGQASYEDTNNGDDEFIETPDDDNNSSEENGEEVDDVNDESNEGNDEDVDRFVELEEFIASYTEARTLYITEGNENVFNFHGDMPQEQIDWMIEDAETLENYEVTYWEITDMELTEDGIHNVFLTKEYQFGNEEVTHEFTTKYVYLVRETEEGFLIDSIDVISSE